MPPVDWSIISSLGSASAAVVVVVLFLRHLNSERKSCDERETRRLEVIKQMNDSHVAQCTMCIDRVAQTEARMLECIDRNTVSGDRNTKVIGQTLELMRTLDGSK